MEEKEKVVKRKKLSKHLLCPRVQFCLACDVISISLRDAVRVLIHSKEFLCSSFPSLADWFDNEFVFNQLQCYRSVINNELLMYYGIVEDQEFECLALNTYVDSFYARYLWYF